LAQAPPLAMAPGLLHAGGLEAAVDGLPHVNWSGLATGVVCSKPAAATFGAVAVAGCGAATGSLGAGGSRQASSSGLPFLPFPHSRGAAGASPLPSIAAASDFFSDAQLLPRLGGSSDGTKALRHVQNLGFLETQPVANDTGFLDVNVRGSSSFSAAQGRNHIPVEEDPEARSALERASEAEAAADKAEVDVRVAVETAEDAAEGALSAAEVAIYTEVIAAMGTIAGICTAWIGWKMHNDQLPPELTVPDVGNKLPPELLKPPPDRRISLCGPTAAGGKGSRPSGTSSSGSASGTPLATPSATAAAGPRPSIDGDDY